MTNMNPYPYISKPEYECEAQPVRRDCLKCERRFIADGKFLRMCRYCRAEA